MKRSKEKRIKKIKKIHVLPQLFFLFLFSIIFAVIIAVVAEIFFMYVVDNHLNDEYNKIELLVNELEEQDDIGSINVADIAGMYDDFAIYDNKADEFVVEPKQEISLVDNIWMEFNEHEIYFDRFDSAGEIIIGDKDRVDVVRIIKETVKHTKVNMNSETMNEELFNFHVWIKEPLAGGKYSLYYSANIILKLRDTIYILIFVAVMAMLAVIPMFLHIISLVASVSGQRRATKLIFYDAVTGGKNWLHFSEQAKRLIRKNKRGKKKYAIVCLKMERYQGYCACYGAMAGEAIIDGIYQTIERNVKRRKEVFSRYAEAEFGMMLLMENNRQLTERVLAMREELIRMVKPRRVDFSIGLCEVPVNGEVDELYGNASLARKSITANSPERYCWFNEKIKEEQRWERFVEENMERALNDGELYVYLQPKYNAATKRLGGAEALIRWVSPTEGFIGPGKFIPIFEKNGFITQIDDFMLSSVAKLQAQWVKEGLNVVPISVNISRAHFTQEDLAEHICKIVDDAGAPKELIELELTESAFFDDKDILINTVEKLKSLGFSVSMDDFGAGYSSLNSLKDLRLDVLKIDADFFRGKEENSDRGSLIVTETIQLAKNLGMTTVAEGIESADQVDFLAKSGCDLIQGFYFAKPMPVGDYVKRMEEDKHFE